MKLNYRHYDRYTKVLLHFDDDNDPFKDECGNIWTPTGNMTIDSTNAKFGKAAQFDGESHLQMNGGIYLGGQDFTIDLWAYCDSTSDTSAQFFEINDLNNDTRLNLRRDNNNIRMWLNNAADISAYEGNIYSVTLTLDSWNHFAITFNGTEQIATLFVNGKLKGSVTKTYLDFTRNNYSINIGVRISENTIDRFIIGAIDEFRISDGIARWTSNFTPPIDPYTADPEILIDSCKLYSIPPSKPRVVLDLANNQKLYSMVVPAKINRPTDNTVALLHFDESTTKDELGNEWNSDPDNYLDTVFIKSGLSSLYINNGNLYREFQLAANTTIEFYFYIWGGAECDFLRQTISSDVFYAISSLPTEDFVFREGIDNENILLESLGSYPPKDQWNHFAFVNGVGTFINGQLVSTYGKDKFAIDKKYTLSIGGGTLIIDELRITNETLYTADFTPPTAPLTIQYEQIDHPLASKIKFTHNNETVAIASKKYDCEVTVKHSDTDVDLYRSGRMGFTVPTVILYKGNSSQSILLDTESFGDAEIVSVSDDSLISTSTDGQRITISATSSGSGSINLRVKEDANYESVIKSIYFENYLMNLSDATPSQIQRVAKLGIAPKMWSVGDVTAVIPFTSVKIGDGNRTYSDHANIIDFEENTIIFAMGKNSAGTVDIAFINDGSNYSGTGTGTHYYEYRHHTNNTNSGGWASSNIRATVLPKFLEIMPEEWQNIITARTVWTDNTGGATETADKVTSTSDKLWIPSEYEVAGTSDFANPYEADHQHQFAYFKNNKIRYKSIATSTKCAWWFRSPSTSGSNYFAVWSASKDAVSSQKASYSLGILPCFQVS